MLNLIFGLIKMKILHIKISFLIVIVLLTSITLKGQLINNLPVSERLQLFTDRNLYIAGEKVYFSVFSTKKQELPKPSLVLYAEIISPEGKRLSGSKFLLKDGVANGYLMIPKDNISGYYYVRVYTKYMRNLGPLSYAYEIIKVINPYRNEVSPGNQSTLIEDLMKAGETKHNIIEIVPSKTEFHPREQINVRINGTDMPHNLAQQFSISVAQEMTSNKTSLQIHKPDTLMSSLVYYPESRGLSITGKIEDNQSGEAASGARINLSIIGEGRDFMATTTDDLGRYYFALPAYEGYRDLFLCGEHRLDNKTKILIDNDFCTSPIQLPSPPFNLSPEERKLAYEMALNARISEVFNANSIQPIKNEDNSSYIAFYGKPSYVLTLDQYVQLPALEEYFNELPSMVKVRKRQNEKYFKVLGGRAEMTIYDPLLLVDYVAVADPGKILAASPNSIARIEVVNEPYVKGNITYGGVISFISKQGDFAGIDLPQSGVFINYLFLSQPYDFSGNDSIPLSTPDTRNTVYWNPNFTLNKDAKAQFSFTAPDSPGQYSITVSWVDLNGIVCRSQVPILVTAE